ncbi:GntR family transcriptional regulator [Lactococcus lactis]|uniref:GntR family transcriptional regulator n=1 Tax=Lactococcus lactis TaxID=1358 RepID=UPI003A8056AB
MNFNLQNQAYNQITGKILRNEYRPGQKISQKNIEIDLQLGRTPVREALLRYVVMDSFTASLNQEPSSQKLI